MKIVAFGASNASTSINAKLAKHAAERFKEKFAQNAEIDLLDINDFEMPLYSTDFEAAEGIPQKAHDFLARLNEADALVISYAEHNGHYPAAYKNLFDWASRVTGKVYQEKPAVYLAASPGPGGAKSVLAAAEASAGFFGAEVQGSLSVPAFQDVFDTEAGRLTDAELIKALDEALEALAAVSVKESA